MKKFIELLKKACRIRLILKHPKHPVIASENDYFKNLEIEDNHLWVDVNNKSVLIKADDEGIVVDIFNKPPPEDFLEEPITSTWCLYNDE